MSTKIDFLIVGAGLSGSVIARQLADSGKSVLIIDKRDHIGGNVYDYYNEDGILVHKYGPHFFHTNSDEVFEYLSRFTDWYHTEHLVRAHVNGKLVPVPINMDTLNILFNLNLKTEEETAKYFESVRVDLKEIKNARDAVVSKVGEELYRLLFEGYTKKQWGIEPERLSAEITKRIPVRTNRDERYHTDKHRAMPDKGYTEMMKRMLDHKNIQVRLKTEFKNDTKDVGYKYLVYTGPIDYFFDFKHGHLRYRSLKFELQTYNMEQYQPYFQINYPSMDVPYTRSVEVKHITGQKASKTTVVREYPTSEGDPYYPMLTDSDQQLYQKYKGEADKLQNVFFVGRLAEFRYFNMDQAVASALKLYKEKLQHLD